MTGPSIDRPAQLSSLTPPAQTGRLRAKMQGALALAKARVAVATGRVAQERVFGHLSDDVWFSVNTTAYRRHAVLRAVLPSLPDPQVQRNFIGNDGDVALGEAFGAYRLIRHLAASCGQPITRETRILDFGCGWGRTIRFFMRDVPSAHLQGVDVMPRAVDLSRANNRWGTFSLIPALPPSGLPAGQFDIIYLYSIFSHLSEDAHDRWLTELQRLLSPRGLLFATTYDRHYIERCERARNGDTSGTHPRSVRSFTGTAAWLERYDRGEYCHTPGEPGDILPNYGETCIPEEYVRRHWSDRFDIRAYLEADLRHLWQNWIVAQRR
jgi:2-polyprenyl-3-methyl-5-hydroxy-6-metoxy-1,4-benzoquinol methylase